MGISGAIRLGGFALLAGICTVLAVRAAPAAAPVAAKGSSCYGMTASGGSKGYGLVLQDGGTALLPPAGPTGASIAVKSRGDGVKIVAGQPTAGAAAPNCTLPPGQTIVDVNRDGFPDLALTNEGDGSVAVVALLGDAVRGPPLCTVKPSQSVVDLDGDGTLDFTVTNQGDRILVSAGGGTGGAAPACVQKPGQSAEAVSSNGSTGPSLVIKDTGNGIVVKSEGAAVR